MGANFKLSNPADSNIYDGLLITLEYSFMNDVLTVFQESFMGKLLNQIKAGPDEWKWKAAMARGDSSSIEDNVIWLSNSYMNLGASSCMKPAKCLIVLSIRTGGGDCTRIVGI